MRPRLIIIFYLMIALPIQAAIYRCETPAGTSFQEAPCAEGASAEVKIKDNRIGTRAVPRMDLGFRDETRHRSRSYAQKSKRKNDQACFSKKQQLETLQWKLRRGYKASTGESMKQRRRVIEDYLRAFCS